ncbi:hypothetical protein DVR14_14680 [Natrinema thermotolerans]|nr:hypothetical protein DVR14_14680 [Natrinema thermotolerans]
MDGATAGQSATERRPRPAVAWTSSEIGSTDRPPSSSARRRASRGPAGRPIQRSSRRFGSPGRRISVGAVHEQ